MWNLWAQSVFCSEFSTTSKKFSCNFRLLFLWRLLANNASRSCYFIPLFRAHVTCAQVTCKSVSLFVFLFLLVCLSLLYVFVFLHACLYFSFCLYLLLYVFVSLCMSLHPPLYVPACLLVCLHFLSHLPLYFSLVLATLPAPIVCKPHNIIAWFYH